MKFEVYIEEKHFERLVHMFKSMDVDVDKLTKEEIIKEVFWVEDRHGNELDLRDNVDVIKIGRKD